MATKSITFEKQLSDLTNIVSTLEKGDLSLEEALNQFEKGMKLATQCQQQLTDASHRIDKIKQAHLDSNEP
jgi:exodeoxyribonuclease VII small subunit